MTTLAQRLEVATVLVVVGVAAQIGTALWNHPLAFLAFMFAASPITLTGTLAYLIALVRED
jgi:hypothetical protein